MMKVTFNKPCVLNGKDYKAGTFQVIDSAVRSLAFKALVKKGIAAIAPRNAAEQKLQAHHDEFQASIAHQTAVKNISRADRIAAAQEQEKLRAVKPAKAASVEAVADEEAPRGKAKK